MPFGAYGALDAIEPETMHGEMSEKEKAYGTEEICEEDEKETYGSKTVWEQVTIVGIVSRLSISPFFNAFNIFFLGANE